MFTTYAILDFSEPIEAWYSGGNGDTIQGWLLKPYGFTSGQTYPLVMYIHGGPEDSWMDEFHYRWNPQTIAAAGYCLLNSSCNVAYRLCCFCAKSSR